MIYLDGAILLVGKVLSYKALSLSLQTIFPDLSRNCPAMKFDVWCGSNGIRPSRVYLQEVRVGCIQIPYLRRWWLI